MTIPRKGLVIPNYKQHRHRSKKIYKVMQTTHRTILKIVWITLIKRMLTWKVEINMSSCALSIYYVCCINRLQTFVCQKKRDIFSFFKIFMVLTVHLLKVHFNYILCYVVSILQPRNQLEPDIKLNRLLLLLVVYHTRFE